MHVKDREEAGMSNLTDEEIRRIGCNEWARYMDEYGYGRPSYLGNRRQRAMVARKMANQQGGGNQHASIKVKSQMQAEQSTKDAA